MEVLDSMPHVNAAHDWRHELFDGLADERSVLVAEHRFHRTIRHDDLTVCIHRHDSLCGGLEQKPQLAIALLVLARSKRVLCTPTLRDVQFKSREPRDLTVSGAISTSETLNPAGGAVSPNDTERVVPSICRWRMEHFLKEAEDPCAVLFMHTAKPRVEGRRFVRGQAVSHAKDGIPIDLIRSSVPRPR